MTNTQKLLTVIVPSYNMEEYLPRCLGSLVVPDEKMLQRLEVIVVNDGSSDKTSEIAHGFEHRHPEVFRVIDKANANYGSCINAALPLATGTFVKILDADDHFDERGFPRFLDDLYEKAKSKDCPVDLVISEYVCEDVFGKVRKHGKFNLPTDHCFSLPDCSKTFIRIGLHSVTYRTSVVKSINYVQTEGISYTDMEWIIEPMVAVKTVCYCPILVYHRVVERTGQTTESSAKIAKHYSDFEKIAKNLASRYGTRIQQNVSPESKKYYQDLVCQFFSSIFATAIAGYHGHKVHVNMDEINRQFEKNPELFNLTESTRLWSRNFPVRIIWCWRRHPGIGTPAIFAFKLIQFVKNFREISFTKTKE